MKEFKITTRIGSLTDRILYGERKAILYGLFVGNNSPQGKLIENDQIPDQLRQGMKLNNGIEYDLTIIGLGPNGLKDIGLYFSAYIKTAVEQTRRLLSRP
ncbi:hypothetical protein A3J90_04710 [candidate division WOR-1 bacterium RIFOXYC2_FULL_37_10]|nr:MAG: hypothetical protein A3J90_04710 [candidate division WOR-1 bacterium RIFOXYC2_FULL_37_10]